MTDLEDLYREIILDHYRSPRNRGELESPPARRVEGFNPLCGDEIVLTLLVDDDQVTDIKFAGSGCSISQSSASLMSSAVKGKTLAEVRGLIRTFKAMMSIHEASLDPDATGGSDEATREGHDGAGESSHNGAGEGSHNGAGEAAHGRSAGGSDDGAAGVPAETANGLGDIRRLGELAALQGVVKFPVRIKCATLGWNALAQALDELDELES